MDGWTDGWMDGWVDGWMGGWMGGWVDGWMDGRTDGWIGSGFGALQLAPRLTFLISSGSKKKEPRCACLSEARASHSHSICAEVSSSAPHLLHNGLSDSPIK
jgi:hypothetical protein